MAGTKNDVLVAKNADFSQAGAPNSQSSESNGLITNGQLWIGSTALNAGGTHINVGTLTAGTGVSITNGPGTITISLAGGGVAVEHLTADTGGQLNPDGSNNFNLFGSGSITTSGSGSTLTTQLTGLTNHAVLVGAGTTTITKIAATANTGAVLQNNSGADPSYSTATYPSTTTINQILYSSAANTVSGVSVTARGLLTTDSSGVPTWRALTDGQFVIGSSSSQPIAANITAGAGISVTNGANSITIAVATGGLTWTDVTSATQALAVENGYLTNRGAGVTYTLPASGVIGDIIIIMGKLGITTIAQNANQQILLSSASSTVGVGGTVVGTNVGDCITLRCITSGASTVWRAESFVGNWTVN